MSFDSCLYLRPKTRIWPYEDKSYSLADVVVVFADVVVVLALDVLVELDAAVEEVTDPPNKLMTDVYAGLVVKFAFQRQASPSPEKVDGIHEYRSV